MAPLENGDRTTPGQNDSDKKKGRKRKEKKQFTPEKTQPKKELEEPEVSEISF